MFDKLRKNWNSMSREEKDDLIYLAAAGGPRPRTKRDVIVLAVLAAIAAIVLGVVVYFVPAN